MSSDLRVEGATFAIDPSVGGMSAGAKGHLQLVEELILVEVCGRADGLPHGLLYLLHLVCLVVYLVQHLHQSTQLKPAIFPTSDYDSTRPST